MSTLRHTYLVNLRGNIKQRANQYARSMEGMGKRSARAMRGMAGATRRHMGAIGQVIKNNERTINRWGKRAGVAVGAGALLGLRHVGTLEERIAQLGVNADLHGEKLDKFAHTTKNSIADAATKWKVPSAQIINGIEGIVERTGDLDFAAKNMENIAIAIRGTASAGQDLGGLFSEIQKMGITKPEEVMEALDIMTAQGKKGAFVLKDLSRLGERVFSAYGPQNIQNIREMGAALQFIRKGTGSSEQATTAFEAILRTLSDKKKIDKLADLKWIDRLGKNRTGIKIFDEEQLKQGKEVLKPINDLMVTFVEASKGKKSNLSQIFDAEAIRGLNALANIYTAGGDIRAQMTELVNLQASGTNQADAKQMGKTMNAGVQGIKSRFEGYIEKRLGGAVEVLAKFTDGLNTDKMNLFFDAVVASTVALGGLAAVSAARKLPGIGKLGKGKLKLYKQSNVLGAASQVRPPLPKPGLAPRAISGAGKLIKPLGIAIGTVTIGRALLEIDPKEAGRKFYYRFKNDQPLGLPMSSTARRMMAEAKARRLRQADIDNKSVLGGNGMQGIDKLIATLNANKEATKATTEKMMQATSVQAVSASAKVVSDAAANTADQAALKATQNLMEKPGKVSIDVHNYDHRSTATVTVQQQPSRVKLEGGNMMTGLTGKE